MQAKEVREFFIPQSKNEIWISRKRTKCGHAHFVFLISFTGAAI
jgi:hypothetical protein